MSFWKAQIAETLLVETVIVSDNDDSDTNVVDKGADVVYHGIVSSNDSDVT